MNVTAPRSWDDVAALQELAEAGNQDAEFWVENPVLWKFPWECDLYPDLLHYPSKPQETP